MDATDFHQQRAVVMGLGRFGGGAGAARFLAQQGARVLVTDTTPADRLRQSVDLLDGLDVTLRLGEHREADFDQADIVIVNPAINPRGNRFVEAARRGGARITSEVRLLVERLPDRRRVIGVTGAAGKSTVTDMCGQMLSRCLGGGRVHVGGNIGGSLLPRLQDIRPDHWVVLELSSFMLDALDADAWSPGVAVVTTFAPNHLDWHGSIDAYRHAKQAILRHQQPGDVAVLGPTVQDWPTQPGVDRTLIGEQGEAINLLVPGLHNQLNARIALATAGLTGAATQAELREKLADFPGLPHRLQFVCEAGGVSYYNDSKATTPEAAQLALAAFPPHTVHLIVGGYDKGADLKPMAESAAGRCRAIYTIGQTGDAIADAAEAAGGEAVRCGTLDRAVAALANRVRQGDVVLLSPGCASWDQFEHFEQRGAAFIEAVLKYTGEGATPPPPPEAPTSSVLDHPPV